MPVLVPRMTGIGSIDSERSLAHSPSLPCDQNDCLETYNGSRGPQKLRIVAKVCVDEESYTTAGFVGSKDGVSQSV